MDCFTFTIAFILLLEILRTKATFTGNWLNSLNTCVLFPLTYPVWLPNSEANKFTKYANSLTRFIPVLTSPSQVNEEVKRQNSFVLCYFLIDYVKFEGRTWKLTVPTDTHLSEGRECTWKNLEIGLEFVKTRPISVLASTEKWKIKLHEKILINKLKCSPNVVLSGLRFIALGTTFVHKHQQNICFMNFDRGFISHII